MAASVTRSVRLLFRSFHRKRNVLLNPIESFQCRNLRWWAVGPEFIRSLSESKVCHGVGELIVYSHDTFGLSWWTAITGLSVGTRILMFPLSLYLQRKAAFAHNLFLELGRKVRTGIDVERIEQGWSEEKAKKEFMRRFGKQKQILAIHHNVSAGRLALLSLIQLPVWLVVTLALRNLCGGLHFIPGDIEPVKSMCTEGILWFPNLLQGDIVLPVILGSITFCSVLLSFVTQPTFPVGIRYQRSLQYIRVVVQTLFGLFMTLIAYNSPSAISYLWTLSVSTGLIQQICFGHRSMKRKLGILPLSWDLGSRHQTPGGAIVEKGRKQKR